MASNLDMIASVGARLHDNLTTFIRLKSMIPDISTYDVSVKPVSAKKYKIYYLGGDEYTTKKPDGVKEYTMPNGEKTKNYKRFQSSIQKGLAPTRMRDAQGKFTAPKFISVTELEARRQAENA